jgi:amidase
VPTRRWRRWDTSPRRAEQRLRVAFSTRTYTGAAPHPDVEVAAQRAAHLCASLGHHVEEAAPVIDGEAFIDAFMTVWSSGAAARLAAVRQMELKPQDVLEPWTLGLAADFEAAGFSHAPGTGVFRADGAGLRGVSVAL